MTPKLYKAADVCESTGLQPYVLRSWEKEFPGIGVQKSRDSPRLYRPSDVEQVLRIKQLVFGEGLTLAGARRRLEESSPAAADVGEAEMADVLDTLGADARARIALVRSGLRSILDVLSKVPGASELAELRRAAPPVDRRDRPSANGRRKGGLSGPPKKARSKARPFAARRKSSPSKRGRGTKRKRASA
ncbi:MAG: MerR family transcriptional regulator [Acidobacteria bacterium]|nr:MerR family transcriptional regulator [Acidobacteriota bacterium]